MATGFLKFDHDHTVYIDLDLAADEVNKAVIIDADDVETPICGGGGDSDFTTAQVSITNNSDDNIIVICPIAIDADNESLAYGAVSLNASETSIVTMILYKGIGIVSTEGFGMISDVTGDIVLEPTRAIVSGDGSITIISGIA